MTRFNISLQEVAILILGILVSIVAIWQSVYYAIDNYYLTF